MQADIQYKSSSRSGVDQIRIGDRSQIGRVRYSPEVKGPEGLEALRRGRAVLDENDPITISGIRAQNIRSQPRFKQHKSQIQSLFTKRPVYFYEPVELFRYRRPQQIVTYGFRGDISRIKDFYSKIRDREFRSAIDLLPRFTQPFVEAQFDSLLGAKDNLPDSQNTIQTSDRVHEAWRDDKTDDGYPKFISNIVEEAEHSPDSGIVPPVPPVMKSSGQDVITRTVGYNDLVWDYCKSAFEDASAGTTTAYLHFYVDKGIFSRSSTNDQTVLNAIRNQLSSKPYAGIAITVSNLPEIWGSDAAALERFISELEVISNEHQIPLFTPRSGYYGMYLTDYGVDIFSSLMNGNLEFNRKGGAPDEVDKYGKLPIYDRCINVKVDKLRDILAQRQGRLYSVQGLPDSPDIFQPNRDSLEDQYGPPRQFRVTYGKQRRLVHLQEAAEIRDEIKRGTVNPSTRYFETSDHPDLQ